MPGKRYCAVATCKSSSKNKVNDDGKGIRFFCFPKDPLRRKMWIRKCGRKFEFTCGTICSLHFRADDFEDEVKARLMNTVPLKLKKTAVPSLNLASSSSKNGKSSLVEGTPSASSRTQRYLKKRRKELVQEILEKDKKREQDELKRKKLFQQILKNRKHVKLEVQDTLEDSSLQVEIVKKEVLEENSDQAVSVKREVLEENSDQAESVKREVLEENSDQDDSEMREVLEESLYQAELEMSKVLVQGISEDCTDHDEWEKRELVQALLAKCRQLNNPSAIESIPPIFIFDPESNKEADRKTIRIRKCKKSMVRDVRNSDLQTLEGSDDLISKLIQLRYDKRDEFKAAGKWGSAHDAWMNVIRDLHLGNQISVLQIQKKWNSLLHKFKDIENKIGVGSCSEELSWPHYNQMQTIMNELSSQENPSILATGNNTETVKIQFSDGVNNENEEETPEHKPSKRDKRDIIDERFIAAVEESNEQLKIMTTTLEKQGEAFIQLMNRLVNAIENQVADDVSM